LYAAARQPAAAPGLYPHHPFAVIDILYKAILNYLKTEKLVILTPGLQLRAWSFAGHA
jgi:hypothetical protein